MPQELHEQVPLMKEVLCAMGVPILTKEGYEADDVLGTAAKRAQADGYEVTIVSGDRDLLQLSDTHIKISIPKTSRGTTEVHNYYPDDVVREYQVTPTQFIDVKALMGDTSDNIPGVPSVGEKTATNLILQFGSVEGVYEHLDEVKPPRAKKALEEHKELAELSYRLAKICIEAPIDFHPEDAKIENLYTKEAYEFMSRMEFKSMLAKFGSHVKGDESKQHKFVMVTDLIAAGELFDQADKADHVGAQLLIDHGVISGLSLCFSNEVGYVLPAVGFLTGGYLAEQMERLCKKGNVWVLDLKSQLPFLNLSYETLVYDAGVAAYLLNPLKTTPKDSYKTSLTGKLLIDSTIYNFNESLDVYNKYINADKFVNLDLQFNGSYSKLLKATVVDANDTKIWEKKTSVGANLNADFYASGPNGAFTGFESYEDTIYTYTFLNGYKIIDANNGNVLKEVSGKMPYYNNVAVNVIIKPNFKKEYKKFKVTFYNKFDSENEIFE